jgi:prolyl oligopeptidase
MIAYGVSKSGSDWFHIRIRNVDSGEDFPEVLQKVKFSDISWTHDSRGIFYCSFPDSDMTG